MSDELLSETEIGRILFDPATRIAHLRRSDARVDWVGDGSVTRRITEAVTQLDPSEVALLIDVRDAPPPRDDDAEAAGAQLRELFARFRAVAVLVRSAVGRLQVQRLAREEGRDLAVFSDEWEARAYLLERLKR